MSVSDAKRGKGESEGISWIISFLKSSFRSGDFEMAERMLKSREERLMSEKKAMEIELQKVLEEWGDMRENVVNVERELEICQTRCSQLELEVEKNKDLELAKRSGDMEIELWKERCKDLEWRVSLLEKETLAFRRIERELFGNREIEPGSLVNEDFCGDGAYKDGNKMGKTEFGSKDGIEGSLSQLPVKGKSSSNREIQTPGKAESTGQSLTVLKECSSSRAAEDQPSSKTSNTPMFFVKEKTTSISSESDMNCQSRVRKQRMFKKVCSNKKHSTSKIGFAKPTLKGIIDISESDGETEIIPCKSRGDNNVAHTPLDNAVKEIVDDEWEMTSKKRLKRTSSDVKADENWSSYGENFPFAGTRRKTASKIVTCDDVSDDDKTPIGKLRMKKIEELGDTLKPKDSQPNNSFLAPSIFLEDENAEEAIMPMQEMSPLRHCKDKFISGERNFAGQLEITGTLHESGIPPSSNAKESDEKMAGLEDVSDGFCKSDDSESEDSSSNTIDALGNDSAIRQVFSNIIRRRKYEKLKWQHVSDMLSSFEVDPELCLMAVCALYRQHTNNRGFSNIDELRVGMLARFLMDGNQEGDLKKSVKELNVYDPKGLEDCKRLAMHYSTQLFRIYQSREDPFFLSLNSQQD